MTTDTNPPFLGPDDSRTTRVVVCSGLSLLLVAFFVSATWLVPISPFYANYDPEFQYLMNSLEVFKGASYAYVDHPGTPLEMIGTAIYAGTYPVLRKGTDAFIRYHLGNPGLFLTLAHSLLLIGSVWCLWSFSSLARSTPGWEDAALAAALGAMYFALQPESFPSLTLWSHNSFNYPFGTLLLVVLYDRMRRAPPAGAVRTPALIGLGLWAGILSSVTIYMAAWILCMLVALLSLNRLRGASWPRAIGADLVVAGSCVAGFALAVLPVWGRMATFSKGIGELLTHEGTDAIGAQSQSLAARLPAGFAVLFPQAPALFISVGVWALLSAIAFALWRKRMHEKPELWSLGLGLAAQIFLLLVFILDHPRAIYLLSVAASLPVLALVVLRIFEYATATSRLLKRATIAFTAVGVLLAFYSALGKQRDEALGISAIEGQTAQTAREYAESLGRQPSDLYVLWTYRSYAPCFSLWFGNDSTGRVFRREIGELCYRQYEFNIWSQKVVSSQGVSNLSDAKWDLIVGCQDGFKATSLAGLGATQTFPGLQLECGDLTIAYNKP